MPSVFAAPLKKSIVLGVTVGWLAQLGLKTLLPFIALFAARMWSLQTEDASLWLEHPDNSAHPVWFVLQVASFLASLIAGLLAGALAPPRRVVVLLALVCLSLVASAFEQIPRPFSATVAAIWIGGPCLGLLFGFGLAQFAKRGDA